MTQRLSRLSHIFKQKGLSNFELEEYLSNEHQFIGCFSEDNLPETVQLPATLIINTGKTKSKGEHWVAVRLNKRCCYYFDTFGIGPIEKNIKAFLGKMYDKVYYSSNCIQHVSSSFCGFYCIIFIKTVFDKASFQKFINYFHPYATFRNDLVASKILNKVL